jgi:hypothetical protein
MSTLSIRWSVMSPRPPPYSSVSPE